MCLGKLFQTLPRKTQRKTMHMDHREFDQFYLIPNVAPNYWMLTLLKNKKNKTCTNHMGIGQTLCISAYPRMPRTLAFDKTD